MGEGERAREASTRCFHLPVPFSCALVDSLSYVPWPGSNPRPLVRWVDALSTEPASQGLTLAFDNKTSLYDFLKSKNICGEKRDDLEQDNFQTALCRLTSSEALGKAILGVGFFICGVGLTRSSLLSFVRTSLVSI